MKRLTLIAATALGIGISASVLFLSTASSKVTEDSEVDYAAYQPDSIADSIHGTIPVTTASQESISMNHSTENLVSKAPYDADTFVRPSDQELKKRLSKVEYEVTQKDGTERPFKNALHDEKRLGLYVDIVSGEPLFSSSDKFDSGTGWPSFSRTISEGVVVERVDRSLFGVRTEIRSTLANSHLGHVFNDGPAPTGNRYCMNSASMRFIPIEDMASSGYGAYIERVSENGVSG